MQPEQTIASNANINQQLEQERINCSCKKENFKCINNLFLSTIIDGYLGFLSQSNLDYLRQNLKKRQLIIA